MRESVPPDCVQAVWLYGSVARNTCTTSSDVDVLLLLRDGDDCDVHILTEYEAQLPALPVEISTYTITVMRRLIAGGSLFAWHLASEGRPVFERDQALSLELRNLAPYRSYEDDFSTLTQLYADAMDSLSDGNTLLFDAGILATVCRNTALLLSATQGRPDFSPWSPLSMRDNSLPGFPLTNSEYALIRACKLAGERGLEAPSVRAEELRRIGARLESWLRATEVHLSERCANVG